MLFGLNGARALSVFLRSYAAATLAWAVIRYGPDAKGCEPETQKDCFRAHKLLLVGTGGSAGHGGMPGTQEQLLNFAGVLYGAESPPAIKPAADNSSGGFSEGRRRSSLSVTLGVT
jgi:hypothetical protein